MESICSFAVAHRRGVRGAADMSGLANCNGQVRLLATASDVVTCRGPSRVRGGRWSPQCPKRRQRLTTKVQATARATAASFATEYEGPRKVAVIGGGPAGLTAAIALRKLCPNIESVKVFEQYESLPPELGAAFNINGGASILAKLGLADDVLAIGNPMERVYSRTTEGSVLFDFKPPELLATVSLATLAELAN